MKKKAKKKGVEWQIERIALGAEPSSPSYVVDMRPLAIDARLALIAGSCTDKRSAWGSLGQLIRNGDGWFTVPPECKDLFMFIADALIKIGNGVDANIAFGLQRTGREPTNLKESFDLLGKYQQLAHQGAKEREAVKVLAVINLASQAKSSIEECNELLRVDEDPKLLKEMDKVRKRLRAANNRFWNALMQKAAIYGGPEAAKEVYERGHKKIPVE